MATGNEADSAGAGSIKGAASTDAVIAASITGLRERLAGSVTTEGEKRYDAARAVHNGRIDRRPALIVHAASAGDVAEAIRFARAENLPLSVRGGGHHVDGACVAEAGVVIDISGMKGLEIDTANRTARAGAGLTMGEFARALHEKGFLVTTGSHDSVGLAGITLCGGIGILMSKYGLVCDNLLSAEVVTADGRIVAASETENPDLFWALRGGGGNFGAVTSLTFRIHSVEPTIAGAVFHPAFRARETLAFYRDYTRDLPDEMNALFAMMTGPDGNPACVIMACYTGPSLEEGERLVAPLREFGPPVMQMLGPAPYTVLLDALKDHDPAGHHYSFACRGLTALPDDLLDAIAAAGSSPTSPGSAVVLYCMHGAASRVAPDATAFPARHIPYFLGIYAGWEPGDAQAHVAWRDSLLSKTAPHADGSGTGYVGLCGDSDDAEAVRSLYGDNYARLARIKAAWDPENVFRHCHNILPEI